MSEKISSANVAIIACNHMGVIQNLPNENSTKRDEIIFDAIKNNNCEFKYLPITSKYKEHTATFEVFADALKIDGIRINVSAKLQQEIADHMGCLLITAKIADLRHQQATTIITPKFRKISSSVQAMIDHSYDIDTEIGAGGDPEIISTVGKNWIIDEKLKRPKFNGMALNYGWHFNKPIPGIKGDFPVLYKEMFGVKVIQSIGSFHDKNHYDYSQTCLLVSRKCFIDSCEKDLIDILSHNDLAFLANHSGKMSVFRQT